MSELSELLNEIINQTETQQKEPVYKRVSNETEFLSIINRISGNDEDVEDTDCVNPRELFVYNMSQTLFSEAVLKFNQIIHLKTKDGFDWNKVQTPESILFKYIDSYLLNKKNGSLKFLEAKLFSKDLNEVKTASFLLSSIDKTTLETVLINFIRAEEEYYPSYIEGLRYSKSEFISDYLVEILDSINYKLKSPILDILLFRNDKKIPNRVSLNDEILMGKIAIINFKPVNKGTVINLANFPQSFEVMFRMMIADNERVVEELESLITKSFITPELLILYAMSGHFDYSYIEKISESKDQLLINACLLASGLCGTKDSIDYLIRSAQKEDLKEISLTALHIALGDFEEENLSEYWISLKRKCFSISTDRIRKGVKINSVILFNEIKNPGATVFERNNAWRELMIREKIFIPFNSNWFTYRQIKSINEIESCLK